MKIYITRHSKTLWNEEKRLQGRLDSELTEEGVENALALKNIFRNIRFNLIMCIQVLFHVLTIQHVYYLIDKTLSRMND